MFRNKCKENHEEMHGNGWGNPYYLTKILIIQQLNVKKGSFNSLPDWENGISNQIEQ